MIFRIDASTCVMAQWPIGRSGLPRALRLIMLVRLAPSDREGTGIFFEMQELLRKRASRSIYRIDI